MDRDFLLDAAPIAAAMLLVRLVASEAVYQHARRTPGGIRFPPGLLMRTAFRLGGPVLLFGAYKVLDQAKAMTDFVLCATAVVMAVGCLAGEPGEIATSSFGLVQTSVLGLKKRRIPWEGAAARYTPGLNEVLVIGSDGTTITHSPHHVSQSEFIHALKSHGLHIQGYDAPKLGL